MVKFFEQCIERHVELTGIDRSKLSAKKPFLLPGIEGSQLKEMAFDSAGELSDIAAKVPTKCLYGARTCRWDLLHAINTLAREVTRWNKACDIRLHKLTCYIQQSVDESLEGWIGDPMSDVHLMLYCDADFASGLKSSKSTSGACIVFVGPNTFMPLSEVCKKQTVVSHSSTEAEIVSLEIALRTEALPILSFWDLVRDVCLPQQSGGDYFARLVGSCFRRGLGLS